MIINIDLNAIVYEDGLMRKTCDTLEEVQKLKKELGDRYRATWRCDYKYPRMSFYIVGYTPENE